MPGDRKVHPDWASTLHISNDGQRLFTTAFGLTNLGTTFAVARAQGHLLCTEMPDYVTAPFVLKQTTGADLICGALKHYVLDLPWASSVFSGPGGLPSGLSLPCGARRRVGAAGG